MVPKPHSVTVIHRRFVSPSLASRNWIEDAPPAVTRWRAKKPGNVWAWNACLASSERSGNNAPFIGLFGTVLGIIKAFSDLSRNQTGGAEVVMAGISEALVATAVGLLVAIPAVVAFNTLQGKIRRAMGRVDAMAHLILSARADDAPTKE